MEGIKKWMNNFAEKHPKAAEWIRKGGLFIIFSYVVTFIKMLLLMFLPSFFKNVVGVGEYEWLWPGIKLTLFNVDFTLAIIGNDIASGGFAYTLANLTTIVIGECINFPLQRNVTFRSHGNLVPQILCHGIATIAVFLVMNLFTCVWNPICLALLPEAIRNLVQSIVTTVVTGGVAMVIIFAVDNKIFADGNKEEAKA